MKLIQYPKKKKNDNTHVFCDMNQETITQLKNIYSLNEDTKIYVQISESNNSDSATIDYTCEYFLENGTKLDLDNIEEDIYIDVYVPIKDLETTNFDLAKTYAKEGFDIYNLNDKFYTDFCTPVSLNGNDMTLEDRKKEIYPNNITLCKSNCAYKCIDLDNQRVICKCNLNNKTNDEILVQDNENFLAYAVDYINYRLFLCYKLFFNAYYIKNSYAFYIILIFFGIVLIFDIIYVSHTLEKLKMFMIKEMPSNIRLNKKIFENSKKCNDKLEKKNKISNDKKTSNPYIRKRKNEDKMNRAKTTRNKNKSGEIAIYNVIKGNNNDLSIRSKEHLNKKTNKEKTEQKLHKRRFSKKYATQKIIKYKGKSQKINKTKENKNEEDINNLPYSKAIKRDERNAFYIFYSFLIEKLDFTYIFCNNSRIKIIIFIEYILSLLINFFFNTLLYTDDVVSNKYHNNGELDIFVSLMLSILSNMITSVLFHFLRYSTGINEIIEFILSTKYDEKNYFKNFKCFYLYLKIKFAFFFMVQLIIFGICLYYIEIFCVKYSCSQISLLINFGYSFLESIITSFAISLIIVLTRIIGLSCHNKAIYYTSQFINNKI